MMVYDKGTGELQNWVLAEKDFDVQYIRKCEAVMCQGNGYMGVRAALDEHYEEQWRGTLVAGTFDQYQTEATELPPCADLTNIQLFMDGEALDLKTGESSDYWIQLNLKTGILTRSFVWTSPSGIKAEFLFERVVSLHDLHLIAARATIRFLSDCTFAVEAGIEGTSRIGDPHFHLVQAGQRGELLQYVEQTNQSGISFVLTSVCEMKVNELVQKSAFKQDEQNIYQCYQVNVKQGDTVVVEKRSNVYTTRDLQTQNLSVTALADYAASCLQGYESFSFNKIAQASADAWDTKVWSMKDVQIDTQNQIDQLALRFAVYHLTVMSPVHDNRMNIGAKGLSGMGYRGHSFWDTEIYMLPYFIFTDPKGARSLLEHRYHGLESAHKKAQENGYCGAMYPWESAWTDDGEVTPSWARTGLLEHHITADVAFGVYNYYEVTADEDFMNRYGYEIVFDTAKYWQSRVTYNEQKGQYEIRNVIGPDEYTEDCDNNAFTNYMAHFNMTLAMTYYDKLKQINPELLQKLSDKLGLSGLYDSWREKTEKLYLPKENQDGIVPQDDTFLTLPVIDITPYKQGKAIDFDLNATQVSKQADVMVLFLLLEDLFSSEVKKKNFYYYEPKCFHHSSLSLSSYSILASDVKEQNVAYDLFEKACVIDMGQAPYSSDDGIHSASLGGIWQCVVLGFLGVRLYGGKLRIQPNLPQKWQKVCASIIWQGQRLNITATQDTLQVMNQGTDPVEFLTNNKSHLCNSHSSVEVKEF